MRITKTLVSITVGLLISISSSIVIADTRSDAITACNTAETVRKAAAKAKMEWTTTKKLIKAGSKSVAKGEFDTAIKLCNEAKFQGEASIKQASTESVAWKARVPK